jgi:uncharacterized paraquat-inducible protein A
MPTCPHCGAELGEDIAAGAECPVCRNVIRPPNPFMRRLYWMMAITALLYFMLLFSLLFAENARWLIGVFALAFLSGAYLLYVMYRAFR